MGVGRRTFAARELATSLTVILLSSSAVGACGPDDGPEPAPPADAGEPHAPAAPGPASGPAPAPVPAPPVERAVRVSFKLDPRLTDGVYMGERWVSPATYHAATQTGSTFSNEARVEHAAGPASATWTPSDLGAIAVEPASGHQVVIMVSRPGRSTLTVSVGDDVAIVTVDAAHTNGTWVVTFRQ